MSYQEISEPEIPEISAQDLKKIIDTNPEIILLDVRTTGEYVRGKIAKSINLPVDEVANEIEKIIPDKNAFVYVYCLSGSRSVYGVEEMIMLGYKNVFNLTNGLLAWRIAGFKEE
jgi:rhodanese-related sulfurtransferase